MWKAVLIGATLVATAAVAQTPAGAPTQSTGLDNDPNQIICVNERITGSRVSQRRVCRTRAEWQAHREESRTVVNEFQNFKPVVCTEPGGGTRNVC
jgi:hypothetical protein